MPDSKCKSVAALALSLIAAPALATDTIYPVGSRVGLIPPAGMVASNKFDGFNDPKRENYHQPWDDIKLIWTGTADSETTTIVIKG